MLYNFNLEFFIFTYKVQYYMVYINVTETNEFTLNINNNVRNWLGSTDILTFNFTHILSDQLKQATAKIDPDPITGWENFFGSFNGRYTEFYMAASQAQSVMTYDGEYSVVITNDNQEVLYRGIWKVTGNSELEENPFIEYQSDNENNDNYIYIEE